MKKNRLVAGLLLVICAVIAIQANTQTSLDPLFELVRDLQKKDMLDGEVFVVKGNRVLFHEQSKEVARCAQNGAPQFLIGSVSKQFTAVALLRALYDASDGNTPEEKCAMVLKQLHSPIASFLPAESRVWNGAMPAWAGKVTLHNLLTHTSGISRSNGILFERAGFDGMWGWINTQHTVAEIMAIPVAHDLTHEPGHKYVYSNEGYILLGEIISAISGKYFTRYIENMCHSVGMNNTYHPDHGTWIDLKDRSNFACLVPGMEYAPTHVDLVLKRPSEQLTHNFSNVRGSGGIVSTVKDLVMWNNALHKTKTLLNPALYEQFITPNLNNYGYGISCKNGIFFHAGLIDSYSSVMMYVPHDDLLIIMLCHVNEDKTLEKTLDTFDSTLRTIICSKNEREDFVDKIIDELSEKYFAHRGAGQIMRLLMKQCHGS